MEEQVWLEQYIHHASQEAFTCLVQKHLPLVYGVAMRQVRDRHLAEDVAQATFALLARKARSIRDAQALPNWLFKAARYASANALRVEQTRKQHEQKAAAMHTEASNPQDQEALWQQILPALEEAMEGLPDPDRQAVLLRFYEDRSLREVGESLGVTEEAARKRVDRAVAKLRDKLVPAGTVGAGGAAMSIDFAALLATYAPVQVPATLASSIAATACQAAAHTTLAATLLKGATTIMGTTTTKIAIGAVAAVVLVGGGAVLIHEQSQPSGSTVVVAPAPSASPVAPAQPAAPEYATAPKLTHQQAVAKIQIGKTTRTELVELLGEPQQYVWGQDSLDPGNLPRVYVMRYDAPLLIMMTDNVVEEIRFEGPGDFAFKDKLRVGSSLEEALALLGKPKQTLDGESLQFREGVLYLNAKGRRPGYGYYARPDQGIRLFLSGNEVGAIYLTRVQPLADTFGARVFTQGKMDQLDLSKATREDVVRLFGEPPRYIWGNQTFTKDKVPAMYLMEYPGAEMIAIRNNQVFEVRFHEPSNYVYKGIKVGSSLEEVSKALGQPTRTVDGEPLGFEDGVLFRNIPGRDGQSYYQRSDQGVRMFLTNNIVTALYLIPPKR